MTAPGWPPVCEHDVRALTLAELKRARREIVASRGLARPGSPVCGPIQAQLTAIDAELAGRASTQTGCQIPLVGVNEQPS